MLHGHWYILGDRGFERVLFKHLPLTVYMIFALPFRFDIAYSKIIPTLNEETLDFHYLDGKDLSSS